MREPSPVELERALAAIRARGHSVTHALETWLVEHPSQRELFVIDAGPAPVGRGEAYTTWLVTFARDGSVLGVSQFASNACRPLR